MKIKNYTDALIEEYDSTHLASATEDDPYADAPLKVTDLDENAMNKFQARALWLLKADYENVGWGEKTLAWLNDWIKKSEEEYKSGVNYFYVTTIKGLFDDDCHIDLTLSDFLHVVFDGEDDEYYEVKDYFNVEEVDSIDDNTSTGITVVMNKVSLK